MSIFNAQADKKTLRSGETFQTVANGPKEGREEEHHTSY